MSLHSVEPHNPVDIARLALKRLAESALAPTPENYASEYRRAAGLPVEPAPAAENDALAPESAAMLLGIVDTIGKTTQGLGVGIERFDGDIKSMFGKVDEPGNDVVRGLIDQMTAATLALQKTVESSRRDLDTTRSRLDQVSAELERSRVLARIDPLTGVVNRRGMEEIVEREIARARRNSGQLALAMLDLDHFKRVNDEHGHEIGDRALVHLATVVKSGLRETDVMCRYGGEEFVVVIPDSGLQGALFVIDRLRVMVEKTPLVIESGKLQIRFSAGVAALSGAEDRDMLLKRADQALYAAKRAGRNRVQVAAAA